MRTLIIRTPWLVCLALVAAACSDSDFKAGYLDTGGITNEGGTVKPDVDTSGLPDGYGELYSCPTPGKACNAHDPCAINPTCGADKKCRPQAVMNCNDGLACTTDTCKGAGLCDNRPKSGFCRLPVKVGANGTCKDLKLDGGAGGPAPDAGVGGKTILCCFTSGQRRPGDQCLQCTPSTGADAGTQTSSVKWSPANGGYCDDGNACTKNDYCTYGQCKGTNYMNVCSDGFSCTTDLCDGKGGCLGNKLKSDYCLINGQCFKENAPHPSGQCVSCVPKVSQSGWSALSNTCTIEGKCYANGAKHTGGCAQCDPAVSTTQWTVSGSFCYVDKVCRKAGAKDPTGCSSCDPTKDNYGWTQLPGVCKINGKCYQAGDKHPQGCAECVPATSSTKWTVKVTTHCLINNACVSSGTKDPTPGSCSSCQPAKNKYDYSADAGYCKINGKCIASGTKHPQGCATCKPASSGSTWTPNSAQQCLIDHECRTKCGSTCADLNSNPYNCGACGTTCSTGLFCVAGKCGAAAPSCFTIKANNAAAKSGIYSLYTGGSKAFSVYCDMDSDSGGWTLVARFSNADKSDWIDHGGWWYDHTTEVGKPTVRNENKDALSQAFWTVKGQEFKISRTDNSTDAHLLKTTGKCLGGKTFRDKIKSFGNFKTGVWASAQVRGTCDAALGNNYSSTSGFKYATCSGNIGKPKSVSFFTDWSSGDGAVLMIGGGGSSCGRADHGIAVTEANAAAFGTSYTRKDFGQDSPTGATNYSLNLFVR